MNTNLAGCMCINAKRRELKKIAFFVPSFLNPCSIKPLKTSSSVIPGITPTTKIKKVIEFSSINFVKISSNSGGDGQIDSPIYPKGKPRSHAPTPKSKR